MVLRLGEVWESPWEVILLVMFALAGRRGGWVRAQLGRLSRWNLPEAGCDQGSTEHPPGGSKAKIVLFSPLGF